jgi:Mrp family chromosome partitioning ATPase/uncharacterized protein involved in exopolysaccharide biosynthesis
MHPMSRTPVTANDHLQPVFRLFRRTVRFWGAGAAALAIGILATGATIRFRPKTYRSEAVLYYREGLQWNPNEASSSRRIGQRLRDILLARNQLTKVIAETNLYPNLVQADRMGEAVEEMLLATTFKVTEGDIFVVSFTGSSPEEAQRVTSTLADTLMEENARLRSGQAEVAQSFLESEKKRNEVELASKEAEYVGFLAKHPEFLPDQSQQGGVGSSLRPRTKPPQSDADLLALRREEQRLRSQLPAARQESGARLESDPAPALEEAEAKLKAAQRDLSERRARFTEEHPDVRSASAALQVAEEGYRRASEAARTSAAPVRQSEVEQQLAEVQREIATYRRRQPQEAPGEDSVGAAGASQRAVALEAEWARLSRQVAEARERFQQLDSKQFMASMTLSTLTSGQAAQLVVIDPAFLPAKPIGMSSTRLLILGIILSLTSGIGISLVLGLLDDRLHERDDVERLAIAPILVEIPTAEGKVAAGKRRGIAGREAMARRSNGSTPGFDGEVSFADPEPITIRAELVAVTATWDPEGRAVSAGALVADSPRTETGRGGRSSSVVRALRVESTPADDPRLVMLRDGDSRSAAAFRVLRHRLAERSAGGAILITSPSGGEGKTFCAVNLAAALAEGRQSHVLLLEANVRSPGLATLLGFQPPVCIAKQLEFFRHMGVHYWEVAETLEPRLHAAAVDPEMASHPELDGPALRACIQDVRHAGYDYVVVDSPAVLGQADVNLVAEAADEIVMVLRAGQSRGREFRKAVDQIGSAKILGIVWLAG